MAALIEDVFKTSEYDDEKTVKNVARTLRGFKGLVIKRQQLRAYYLAGQAYDGMPHSTTNINHEEEKEMIRLHNQEKNQFEINLIVNALKLMGEVDDENERLATILELQFVDFNKIDACCYKYAQKYHLADFPKATFYDHRKVAMLKFPAFYPRELRVKKAKIEQKIISD